MRAFARFERRLEGLVEGAFARAFRSELQPVEVARALTREVDDRAAIIGKGRVLVPNDFVVEIGETDHDRLSVYSESLGAELATVVREHVDEESYHLVGPVRIRFRHADDLRTGVFRVKSGVQQGTDQPPAPPRREEPPPPPYEPAEYFGPAGYPGPAYAGADDRTKVTPMPSRPQARLENADGTLAGAISAPVSVIGRGSDSDVKITDPGISRRHAEIRQEGGEYLIADLGSTNGTIVDGRPVRRATLYDGARIQIGRTTLTFHLGG